MLTLSDERDNNEVGHHLSFIFALYSVTTVPIFSPRTTRSRLPTVSISKTIRGKWFSLRCPYRRP